MSSPVGRRVEAGQARRGDDGKRAAVSFEPEPERDEGGARRYTYVQDRSSKLEDRDERLPEMRYYDGAPTRDSNSEYTQGEWNGYAGSVCGMLDAGARCEVGVYVGVAGHEAAVRVRIAR